MAVKSGDRSEHFPAIERKHGKPIAFFVAELESLGDAKYPAQISLLRERYGFSQTHANALVMFVRGSTTSRRFDDVESFLRDLGGERERSARAILDAVAQQFPELELVVAWNKPNFRLGKDYVFGIAAATKHLLLAPMGDGVVAAFEPRLTGYVVNKKTVAVPLDWEIDADLLGDFVRYRLAELAADGA